MKFREDDCLSHHLMSDSRVPLLRKASVIDSCCWMSNNRLYTGFVQCLVFSSSLASLRHSTIFGSLDMIVLSISQISSLVALALSIFSLSMDWMLGAMYGILPYQPGLKSRGECLKRPFDHFRQSTSGNRYLNDLAFISRGGQITPRIPALFLIW